MKQFKKTIYKIAKIFLRFFGVIEKEEQLDWKIPVTVGWVTFVSALMGIIIFGIEFPITIWILFMLTLLLISNFDKALLQIGELK